MSRRQRPPRRLASSRAARRRRQLLSSPERLPAPPAEPSADGEGARELDYDDFRDSSTFDWEAD